ncbi:MAG: hypothetical protein CL743_01755 [Chloroflexi bacterium]|nr:hypothetical protein [Chloroflexota bacterium]
MVIFRMNKIKLFISDVDGTLTDGGMYYSSQGELMKKFNTRDAVGLRLLQESNVKVALITGEDSDIVRARAAKLNIDHLFTGINDKVKILDHLCSELNITPKQVSYVGDDINDLEIIKQVGLSFAVYDAEPIISDTATIQLSTSGGHGAVREAARYILEHNL